MARRLAAASTSQIGRFETELLAIDDNLGVLEDLPGLWRAIRLPKARSTGPEWSS